MHAGAAVGLCPDGIGGIFTAASGAVPWGRDALALGRKRGLMRLVLRHGATCMPGYFVGTLQLYTISHDRFGILAALSRRLRLSLFLFHGRFGLPIPRRGPLTAVVAFVPPFPQRIQYAVQRKRDWCELQWPTTVRGHGGLDVHIGAKPENQ